MYPAQSGMLPWSTGRYLPYFYHAGLYRSHPTHPPARPSATSDHGYAPYDFSSERPAWDRLERVQTVEQVVQAGYFAVPEADPVTAIISDKQHTSRLGLDDVIRQIRQRHRIYEQNIYEINQAVCEVHNSLFRQMAEHGLTVANEKQQYSVTKQVQKLYEQQRQERTDLWRDVSRLKLALPETAQQYLSAHRKVSALQAQEGDAP